MRSAATSTVDTGHELASGESELGRVRNLTKASVRRVTGSRGTTVVKSVAARPWYCRFLFGGFLVRREGAILARLQPLSCVPRLLERSAHTIVMEHVVGTRLGDHGLTGIDARSLQEIESAFAELHSHGFAHGDFGPSDVILRRGGGVTLLDFATAAGPGSPPLLSWLVVPLARWNDHRRMRRLMRRYRRNRERVLRGELLLTDND